METISRTIEPGKWRIKLKRGHVVSVRLVGMRQRRHFLNEWSRNDFYAHQKSEESVLLRGVPLAWLQDGPYLMIWPSPAHEWQMEYDMVEKAG